MTEISISNRGTIGCVRGAKIRRVKKSAREVRNSIDEESTHITVTKLKHFYYSDKILCASKSPSCCQFYLRSDSSNKRDHVICTECFSNEMTRIALVCSLDAKQRSDYRSKVCANNNGYYVIPYQIADQQLTFKVDAYVCFLTKECRLFVKQLATEAFNARNKAKA